MVIEKINYYESNIKEIEHLLYFSNASANRVKTKQSRIYNNAYYTSTGCLKMEHLKINNNLLLKAQEQFLGCQPITVRLKYLDNRRANKFKYYIVI